MSNKTSDKNVANIEDDIKLVKRYLENSAYKETDSDFFKNGGWEMVDLEIPKAMANILAEREQDKRRIKELEEEENEELLEVKISCSAVNIIENLQKENESKQKAYDDCYCEYKKYKQFDSIPKQAVIDTINENGFEVYTREYGNIEVVSIDVLQELLEGEK